MLSSLHIENIAVIKNADIDFTEGFNVITGQTGAGKSMLIDSINLVMGARAEREMIRTGETGASVDALFTNCPEKCLSVLRDYGLPCDGGEISIHKELYTDGKTVTKVNGRSVSVSALREICAHLVNIHGQHDNQLLLNPENHIEFLDQYANNRELLEKYKVDYSAYISALNKLKKTEIDDKDKARRMDMLEYRIKEIDSAKLKPGEDTALDDTKKKIKSYEKINRAVSVVYMALYENEKGITAMSLIDKASAAISTLSDVLPESDAVVSRLVDIKEELASITEKVDSLSHDMKGNADDILTKIESRLALIDKLKSKYGETIDEILSYRDSLREEYDALANSENIYKELSSECGRLKDIAAKSAIELSKARACAAESLSKKITEVLSYLDMPAARFSVDILPADDLTKDGCDEVEFIFSANAGEPMLPLAKIASGGELARVMLAIKSVLTEKDDGMLLIFDEIDTGISGKTSVKIGRKLKELSLRSQVMCVTHSAQIASGANTHFLIYKSEDNDRTFCHVKALEREERISEIARIIGGETITETVLATAKELLNESEEC